MPQLAPDDVQSHLDRLFPSHVAYEHSASAIAFQFGHLVLLQGVVGGYEWVRPEPLPPPDACSENTSTGVSNCGAAPEYFEGFSIVANRLLQPSLLSNMVAVDASTIAWMHSSHRVDAYHPSREPDLDFGSMNATFGALSAQDLYYSRSPLGGPPQGVYPLAPLELFFEPPYTELGPLGAEFLANLVYVRTFMTNAALDAVVQTRYAPLGWRDLYPHIIDEAVIDTNDPANSARPGNMHVRYMDAKIGERTIRTPSYAASGHHVSRDQPAELLADVVDWWSRNP